MSFTLYLDGETVPLAKPMEAGVYDALVLVQPYRISDDSPTNNAEIRLALVVE